MGNQQHVKLLNMFLIKNKISAITVGNIGKPLLNINLQKNQIVIIEASSFQLSYSKYRKTKLCFTLKHIERPSRLAWFYEKNMLMQNLKFFKQKKNNIALLK